MEDKGFKKYKLIYSGELLLIAVVFLVLGILKLTGVMTSKQPRIAIFNWITIFGGLWIITDLIWTLVSKKRRNEMINGNESHIKKPDCDNIAKICLDALNHIAFNDDSQITDLVIRKRYGENPNVVVSIRKK